MRQGCLILFVVFLVIFVLAQIVAVPVIVNAQKAGCDVLQSALGQINPNTETVSPPMTAEQCKAAVDASILVPRFIAFVGSLIATGGLVVLFLAYAFFFGGNSKSKSVNSADFV